MERPDPVDAARWLIADRYPQAIQAWLGGSVYAGRSTESSDLDVTVLLAVAEVHRESVTYRGWPVELFVHTEASIQYFVQKDAASRRPTMARLVANSIPLLPGGGGAGIRSRCAAVLDDGPAPLTDPEMRLARYSLTDLLDDLSGGGSAPVMDAVVVETWRRAAELLLASERRWRGAGKWLIREIETMDAEAGTSFALRFHQALEDAVSGQLGSMTKLADDVLERVGDRLWDGFLLTASLPAQ